MPQAPALTYTTVEEIFVADIAGDVVKPMRYTWKMKLVDEDYVHVTT